MTAPPRRLTEILQSRDAPSAETLLPMVYDHLRSLARDQLAREKPGQTLQPTALVHEAFLRIAGSEDPGWDGRQHFFSAAAEAMRRILIDQARRKAAVVHGGRLARRDIAADDLGIEPPDDRLLEVDEALNRLETADPEARRLVNLRYFAGLSIDETASVLGVSPSTVDREWRFVRAFLRDELAES